MTRAFSRSDVRKRNQEKRRYALERFELRDARDPFDRAFASGPTSPAIKQRDSETERLIREFERKLRGGETVHA